MPGIPIELRRAGAVLAWLLAVGMLTTCAGCGRGRLAVAPVEGKVLHKGKPLPFGSVIFQPDAGPAARGVIQPDGTFKLSTYGDGDGAVISRHRVRIAAFANQNPQIPLDSPQRQPGVGRALIPSKYANFDSSGLSVEVETDNEPFVFDLKE